MKLLPVLVAMIKYYNYHLLTIVALDIMFYILPNVNSVWIFFIIPLINIGKLFSAIILGRISDLYGKELTLKVALIISTFSLIVFIFLPPWGYISLTMLILARFMFIISFSGSGDASRIIMFEKADYYKGLSLSVISFCVTLSISLVYFINAIIKDNIDIVIYWRISFLIGFIATVGMLFFITPKRESSKENAESFSIVFSDNPRVALAGIMIAGLAGGIAQFDSIFLPKIFFTQYIIEPNIDWLMGYYSLIGAITALIGGLTIDITGSLLFTYCFGMLFVLSSILGLVLSNYSINYLFLFAIGRGFIIIASIYTIIIAHSRLEYRVRFFSFCHAIGSFCISSWLVAIMSSLVRVNLIYPFIFFTILLCLSFLSIFYIQSGKIVRQT